MQCRLGSTQPSQIAGETVEVGRGSVGGLCLLNDKAVRPGVVIGPETSRNSWLTTSIWDSGGEQQSCGYSGAAARVP